MKEQREIYLAGGCFWGLEKYLSNIHGVTQVEVGYANGHTEKPSYEEVCTDTSGHVETVKVVYDPRQVSLRFILNLFYEVIDPTSMNRQGGDTGTQYRTGIYYIDDQDFPIIQQSIAQLQQKYTNPIVIETKTLSCYYKAEEYHQKYLDKNPSGYCHISPVMFEKAKQAKEYARKSKEELKSVLTEIQYTVTQNNDTERPFQNEYYDNFEKGIYVDITTGQPLFISDDKFDAGCGWPSFSKPITEDLITELADHTLGRTRTEVRSAVGDAHLGHVFNDGPTELGGLRYCINSAALRFVPKDRMIQEGYGHLLPLLEN